MKKSSKVIAGLFALFVCIPFGRWFGALFSDTERQSPWTWVALIFFGSLVVSAVGVVCGFTSSRRLALWLHGIFTITAGVYTFKSATYKAPPESLIGLAVGVEILMFGLATIISVAFWVWLLRLRLDLPNERTA